MANCILMLSSLLLQSHHSFTNTLTLYIIGYTNGKRYIYWHKLILICLPNSTQPANRSEKRHLNITMCSYTLALVYILYFLRDDGNPLFEINSICAYLVVLPQLTLTCV